MTGVIAAVLVILLSILLFRVFTSGRRSLQSKICKENSKSFYFACQLFPKEIKEKIFIFYAFARAADDLIDEVETEVQQKMNIKFLEAVIKDISSEKAQDIIMELLAKNADSFASIKKDKSLNPIDIDLNPLEINNISYILLDFSDLMKKHKIEQWVPTLLFEGLKQDTIKSEIENEDELLNYCLGVASSIGIFCCYIFDSKENKTLVHATSLGIAMQLTNIARDILTDIEIGRTYIPNTWFLAANVSRTEFMNMSEKERMPYLLLFAKKLLNLSENYYQMGWKGILLLPPYAVVPVAAALMIYRDIGTQLVSVMNAQGIYPKRAYTTKTRKLWLYLLTRVYIWLGIYPSFSASKDIENKSEELLASFKARKSLK